VADVKRLIDADALLEQFSERYSEAFGKVITGFNQAAWKGYCNGVAWARIAISEAAGIDAAPVVHGRWIDVSLRYTQVKEKCSVCEGVVYAHEYNYCPHCGAKMDGDPT
jgi:hypothetical protein